MRSLYDDVFGTLTANTFTIPNVSVRTPFDTSKKTYPIIVVHEIVNQPKGETATVNGEERTTLVYQLDILTKDCVDSEHKVVGAWAASRRLVAEVTDLLSATYSITRRSVIPPGALGTDVISTIWRGECVLDSTGYAYRR